jgi:hypothetical protein
MTTLTILTDAASDHYRDLLPQLGLMGVTLRR